MSRSMGNFIRFRRRPGPKPTGRHCASCGGNIYEGQEQQEIPFHPKGAPKTTLMAYRHADPADCSRELNHWWHGGSDPDIDEWELNDQTTPGNTSRHTRQGGTY